MEHADLEVLDLEEGMLPLPRVMVSRRRAGSFKSSVWRVCGVFLAVALCTAAAVCFMLNKSQNNQESATGLRLTMRDHFSKANFTSKAAIHLTGAYNPEASNTSLDWRVNQDQAFSSGGLKLANREIIIPEDGIYFVYSQVSFYISCTAEETEYNEFVHMTHMVSRYSKSYEDTKPLLSAIRSTCVYKSETDDLSYNTIYLGAAFQLLGGDRLLTETTPILLPHVETENGKSFFGVFAL